MGVLRIIPVQESSKIRFRGGRHSPANNKQAGRSRNTKPEQLARLEVPPVRKAEGALSVALVEVPFGGAPVELDTRALVVLLNAGTEVDVTVCAVVVPRKLDG